MLAGLLTRKIKEEAIALGFDRVGIAPVEAVPDDKLLSWLRLEYQGEMRYMARQIEKRLDPNRILPGAKSVVSVALNYYHDYGLPTRMPPLESFG